MLMSFVNLGLGHKFGQSRHCYRERSRIFAASFAEGAVKVFDRLLEEEDAIVRCFSEHTA
jgi:hypothetical protein